MRDVGFTKGQLVVCGDSFSYGINYNHWPAIVARHFNLQLINLAIVGCSNIAIAHQISYCLKYYKPKLLIVSLSAAERFEIDKAPDEIPASLEDFRHNIDEITYRMFSKKSTIDSGNLRSHHRNTKLNRNITVNLSYRLQAQTQAWCINYLLSKVQCKYLLYRNIFPRYHIDKEMYKDEYYFDLDNFINSGPYDYESEQVKTTNHLSKTNNYLFAKRVLNDYKFNF